MSDEEYGRAWAAMMGKRPRYEPAERHGFHDLWMWLPTDTSKPDQPWYVTGIIYGSMNTHGGYTEAEAYATLGRAVRRIHAAVPHLPGEPSTRDATPPTAPEPAR